MRLLVFPLDILYPSVDSGTTYHDKVSLPCDRWFQFELLYTMNTPGTANGVVKYWVDGISSFLQPM